MNGIYWLSIAAVYNGVLPNENLWGWTSVRNRVYVNLCVFFSKAVSWNCLQPYFFGQGTGRIVIDERVGLDYNSGSYGREES